MVWQWKYSWQSYLGLLLDKDNLYEIRKSRVSIIIIHWQQVARSLMVFWPTDLWLNNHKERTGTRWFRDTEYDYVGSRNFTKLSQMLTQQILLLLLEATSEISSFAMSEIFSWATCFFTEVIYWSTVAKNGRHVLTEMSFLSRAWAHCVATNFWVCVSTYSTNI